VTGRSRVFLFFLPNEGTGLRLIAKFDDPKRAEREWRVIERIRPLNVPPDTVLPHSRNERSDGLILYATAVHPLLREYCTLAEFVHDNLRRARECCVRCLDLLFEPLLFFYVTKPGTFQDRDGGGVLLTWAHFFAEVPKETE